MRARQVVYGMALLAAIATTATAKDEKWPGVDEAVVRKYAEKRGVMAKEPLIDIEGDMLLFVFTLAGAAGGFVIGYNFRKLFGERKR